jgi:hypothetical protein
VCIHIYITELDAVLLTGYLFCCAHHAVAFAVSCALSLLQQIISELLFIPMVN